jgi:hypothetical protein
MNPKTLVRISNIIGIVSILLLIYWVFIFITIEVFGLKVFRENITETFYMSIMGILALMFGALIINIMFNLTRIAQKHNNDISFMAKKNSKAGVVLLLVSFPVILAFLFTGDYLTSKKKEQMLIDSAKSIIMDHQNKADALVNYTFTKEWIDNTNEHLDLLEKTDKHFSTIAVIVKESVKDSEVYLGFSNYNSYINPKDTLVPQKIKYIRETTLEEREYLDKVFNKGSDEKRFSGHDGNYELFYPYRKNGKQIVFYYSDRRRYGKIGS